MTRLSVSGIATLIVTVSAALVGCGAPMGAGESPGGPAAGKAAGTPPRSAAEQIIVANAQAERDARLIARKVLNNGTEVAEFYEPAPGQILFSAAGSPTEGTVVKRELIEGKTASEVWAAVAGGEPVPQALAAAIERSRNPVAAAQAAELQRAQPAIGEASAVGAEGPKSEKLSPFAGGYCATRFWQDWANWGAGSSRAVATYQHGWNWQSWSNVTATAGYIVCPQGDVSGTGGRLTIDFPNGSGVWNVAPNSYRWETWTAGADCGWDISCLGTRCTPVAFGISGRYDSDCFLSRGSSCGDKYDWITFAGSQGSYCQNTGGNPGGGGTPSCNLTCYSNCGNGCIWSGAQWCSFQDAAAAYPGCGIYCGTDPQSSSVCNQG
jgi:hypothetical protein